MEDVLNYVMPYIPFVGADSLFMQDNTHPHVAHNIYPDS